MMQSMIFIFGIYCLFADCVCKILQVSEIICLYRKILKRRNSLKINKNAEIYSLIKNPFRWTRTRMMYLNSMGESIDNFCSNNWPFQQYAHWAGDFWWCSRYHLSVFTFLPKFFSSRDSSRCYFLFVFFTWKVLGEVVTVACTAFSWWRDGRGTVVRATPRRAMQEDSCEGCGSYVFVSDSSGGNN